MSKQKDVFLQSESRDGRAYQVKARAGHLKELLPILQESKTGSPYQEQKKNQICVKEIARKAPSHRGICHVFFYFLLFGELFSLLLGEMYHGQRH